MPTFPKSQAGPLTIAQCFLLLVRSRGIWELLAMVPVSFCLPVCFLPVLETSTVPYHGRRDRNTWARVAVPWHSEP